jgi:signal peptidase I
VFRLPRNFGLKSDRGIDRVAIIKRIVGMPGDTLAMRDGLLTVNGTSEQNKNVTSRSRGPDRTDSRVGWLALIAENRSSGGNKSKLSVQDWGPVVVPPRHFFVLGDNRLNSVDSRELGLVPEEAIIGRAVIVYGSWIGTSNQPPYLSHVLVRWSRFGQLIR